MKTPTLKATLIALILAPALGCSAPCPVGSPCDRSCPRDEMALCGIESECICAPILNEETLNLDPPPSGGALSEAAGSPCPAPQPGDLRISEILINAPAPEAEHEFVELVNLTDHPVSLDSVQVLAKRGQSLKPRVIFNAGCLPARGALALYADPGRWVWDPAPDLPAAAEVSAFGFSNSADFHFELRGLGDVTLDSLSGPAAIIPEDVSLVRHPDLTRDALAIHDRVDPSGAESSPGRCVGGGRFVEGCPEAERGEGADPSPDEGSGGGSAETASGGAEAPICPPPEVEELAINEILIDGVTPDDEHEFIEILNTTDHRIDLTGVKVTGARGQARVDRVSFRGGCLPAHGGIAIFKDRQLPELTPDVGIAEVEIETRRFGMNNSDDFDMRILDPGGRLIHQLSGPGDLDAEGVSVVPSASGATDHLTATGGERPASPGLCQSGEPFGGGCR